VQRARYAILLDGGFITKKLYSALNPPGTATPVHATADDIVKLCARLQALPDVANYELLRIYYYDAAPASGRTQKPVSRSQYNLGATDRFRLSESLLANLVLKPNFALRLGEVKLSQDRWRLRADVARELIANLRPLTDGDFLPDLQQKGVDMRVGMDMARLALREMVRAVVVVTGDSDFIPVFKFVRREGVRVIVDTMRQNTKGLREHADIVADVAMP
jgi:uncharacterized LabA/DUF88 family protein